MKKYILLSIVLFVSILASTFLFLKYRHIDKNKIETKIIQTIDKVEEIKSTIAPEPTKILESGLPNYHLIKTSFVPQSPEKNWDQPWQDACEEAALLIAYYYYNQITPDTLQIKEKLLDVINYENKESWGTSINIDKINQVANNFLNLSSEIIKDPTIDDIKRSLVNNRLILIPSAGKILFKENKYFNDGGPQYHALIVLGFDDDKQKFIVHDVGTQHGAYFKYSYFLLMDSIHDFPASNKKEDILNGSKRLLVLYSNET